MVTDEFRDCRCYGRIDAPTGKLAKLSKSKKFLRLALVFQYGPSSLSWCPKVTRYEHCLGTAWLCGHLGCSIEEQVAALLHDVTHGAFSHTLDEVFAKDSNERKIGGGRRSYHDVFALSLLSSSSLPAQLSEFFPDRAWQSFFEKSYWPSLASDSPSLCADRFDNILRDGRAMGLLSLDQSQALLTALRRDPESGSLTMSDLSMARLLFDTIDELNEVLYCHPRNLGLSLCFSKMLRRALDGSFITKDDLFDLGDERVWSMLMDIDDAILRSLRAIIEKEQQFIDQGSEETVFELDGGEIGGDYEFFWELAFLGYRRIDPLVTGPWGSCLLSGLDEGVGKRIEQLKASSHSRVLRVRHRAIL